MPLGQGDLTIYHKVSYRHDIVCKSGVHLCWFFKACVSTNNDIMNSGGWLWWWTPINFISSTYVFNSVIEIDEIPDKRYGAFELVGESL